MSEKTEFLQAIDDAILDADSLEKFINGDDSETVLTRLSAEYPTLQKAIKQLFENGGLPATPFVDLTSLNGSELPIGSYAVVTDDSASINGLYYRSELGWAKTNFLNNIGELSESIHTNSTLNLVEVVDSVGGMVARLDSDAKLHLSHLEKPVQDILKDVIEQDEHKEILVNSLSEQLKELPATGRLLEFIDSEGVVFGFFDIKGGLHLSGLHKSVQQSFKSLNEPMSYSFFRQSHIGEKLQAKEQVLQKTQQISLTGGRLAPIPFEYMTLNYRLSTDFLDLKVSDPEHTPIDTMYDLPGDGRVVHPTVIQCRDKVAGFNYILGITPFADSVDALENPLIYGTNDFEEYTLISKEPLAARPYHFEKGDTNPYNSDIFFTYDYETGDIVCGWRECHTESGVLTEYLKIRRSKDCMSWGEVQTIWTKQNDSNTELYLSPSIVYNFEEDVYDMYGVAGRNPYIINKYSTKSLCSPDWVDKGHNTLKITGVTPWHLEVRYVGESLVAMVNGSSSLYMAISQDNGTSWQTSSSNIFVGDHLGTYKGSFIPIYESRTKMHMRYVWTTTLSGGSQSFLLKSAATDSFNY